MAAKCIRGRWLKKARESRNTPEMAEHEHPTADAQYDSALQTLRAHQHRVTGPRKAILSILTHEHCRSPWRRFISGWKRAGAIW